jgi:glycerol kinase
MIWWLTGGPRGGSHVTDYTNGSRTMLMNINKLEWDQEILRLLKIPEEILPELKPSSDKNFYGYTKEDSIFSSKIPVCGDLGDQQAALVGQACFREGESKNTYGTGCFMLSNIGNSPKLSKEGLLTTCAYSFEERKTVYALEGSIAIAGSVIQWLRDNLKIIGSASETEKIAESIKDEGSGGVYFVPAFNGLYAPYWDPYARGIICGLTSFIKKEHLVHAALESICWQTRDVFETMTRASGVGLEILKVDGGAVVNNYLMQLQADILGTKVVRPKFFETTSLGVAYAAGLAVSFWKNTNEIVKLWKKDRIFEPEWSDDKRERLYIGWKEAVKLSMGWLKKVS